MSIHDVQELVFPSGAKLKYIFSTFKESDINLDSEAELDALDELSDYKILGPFSEKVSKTAPRYPEHILSRFLLLNLIKDFKKSNHRGLAVSISHTKDAAVVLGAPNFAVEGIALASGVGVDLEYNNRKLSEAAFKRLIVDEREKKIVPLDLWCMKEAAYKAHPNNQIQGLLLSDFVVFSDDKIKCLKTQQLLEVKKLSMDAYCLFFARTLR